MQTNGEIMPQKHHFHANTIQANLFAHNIYSSMHFIVCVCVCCGEGNEDRHVQIVKIPVLVMVVVVAFIEERACIVLIHIIIYSAGMQDLKAFHPFIQLSGMNFHTEQRKNNHNILIYYSLCFKYFVLSLYIIL